jgi:hypothetical protein
MKLYPRCHPIEYTKIDKTNALTQGAAYTATGYLVPCCWCDTSKNEELVALGLFDEELKLNNNKSIKSILLSKQWINFHKILIDSPESAPSICKQKCCESVIKKEIEELNDD